MRAKPRVVNCLRVAFPHRCWRCDCLSSVAKGGQRGTAQHRGSDRTMITDEAFRDAFLATRLVALQDSVEAGYELTRVEVFEIPAPPATLWRVVATQIDPRLQRTRLPSRYGAAYRSLS